MEKGEGSSSSSNAVPTVPLPSAPPTYEEAVGLIQPTVMSPPYPVNQLTMPIPYPTPVMPPSQAQGGSPSTPSTSLGTTSSNRPSSNIALNKQSPGRTTQTSIVELRPHPVKLNCPSCQNDIKTTTITDHQPGAHVCCCLLCLIGCCLCSCIPYIMKSFMNVHHFCPICKAHIGTWRA